MIDLNKRELDTIRQWFDCVQDVHPKYLNDIDYRLAIRIYHELGMRVPNSIKKPLNR